MYRGLLIMASSVSVKFKQLETSTPQSRHDTRTILCAARRVLSHLLLLRTHHWIIEHDSQLCQPQTR
jgi:hemin uptake protein HemP